jgi:hypothetical protein
MTLPTIFPLGFDGTDKDFLKTKANLNGAAVLVNGSVSVASGTVVSTNVGLVPFNKGAKFNISDKSVYVDNIGDASLTVNLGIIYNDNVTFTNDVDAFASLSTAGQAGGFITIDEKEGLTFVAEADGWLNIQTAGSTTDATGLIRFNVLVSY